MNKYTRAAAYKIKVLFLGMVVNEIERAIEYVVARKLLKKDL